jgi:hypothetical protein
VLQALDDIWGRPMGSVDFLQAVAFFTGTGTWAESRTIIADFLEFHRDDLEALGKRCLDARHKKDALPPGTARPAPNALSTALLNLSRNAALPQKANTRGFPGSWNGTMPPSPHPDRSGSRPALMPAR